MILYITLVGKKDDSGYEQVRGHVPKSLAKKFKQFCLDYDLDYSEGLEHVLTTFFESGLHETQVSAPQPLPKEINQ